MLKKNKKKPVIGRFNCAYKTVCKHVHPSGSIFFIVLHLHSPLQIYFWGQSRAATAKRRRRAIPKYADFVNVPGGNTQSYEVKKLTPYTSYNLAIKAFNSGGEGPASIEVDAETDEAGMLRNVLIIYTDHAAGISII